MPPRTSSCPSLTHTAKGTAPRPHQHHGARSFHCTARTHYPRRKDALASLSKEDQRVERRAMMFAWLEGPGRRFKQPQKAGPNYLGSLQERGGANQAETFGGETDRTESQQDDLVVYPLNRQFRSQPVLSEEFREEVWRRVMEDGLDIKVVSATMGVTVERVAAVVRLKEVEKRWQREGKPLATPYSRAVLSMLPQTPFDPAKSPVAHESINDLPVHRHTKSQLFAPVPESKAFTRVDAGRAFDRDLLPAERRIPHPQLVDMERDRLRGLREEELLERATARIREEQATREARREKIAQKRAKETTVVSAGRWDFVFRHVDAEAVGKDGRDPRGVGWRYGVPHEDRKKGQVKIPTRVL